MVRRDQGTRSAKRKTTKTKKKSKPKTKASKKLEQGPVSEMPLNQLRPSPENDRLYRPIDRNDPDLKALAKSIKRHGVREPLVVTLDDWIVSGHRRYAAAKLAGLDMVPVRVEAFRRDDDIDRFIELLREYNRQRVKSFDEQLREEVVSAEPDEAYRALIEHREQSAVVDVETIYIKGSKQRCRISKAKQPFLAAIRRVLKARRKFWPLTVRQIHYALLNDPPLRHASKPNSTYANDEASYKSLCDLALRARLADEISIHAIADDTRPVIEWRGFDDTASFVRGELSDFLKRYRRNLQRSQPNHIEIIGEKNTVATIINRVARRYSIPTTMGRGYASLPPRRDMAARFHASGKQQLVLLFLSDFDPEGEDIAHSFARSMRDDFGIDDIVPVKVALTAEQVERFALPPMMQAKRSSSRYKRFVEQHGDTVHELEALSPEDLQELLAEVVDSVLDIEAFNAEVDAEREDAAFLDTTRRRVQRALRGVLGDGEGNDDGEE